MFTGLLVAPQLSQHSPSLAMSNRSGGRAQMMQMSLGECVSACGRTANCQAPHGLDDHAHVEAASAMGWMHAIVHKTGSHINVTPKRAVPPCIANTDCHAGCSTVKGCAQKPAAQLCPEQLFSSRLCPFYPDKPSVVRSRWPYHRQSCLAPRHASLLLAMRAGPHPQAQPHM